MSPLHHPSPRPTEGGTWLTCGARAWKVALVSWVSVGGARGESEFPGKKDFLSLARKAMESFQGARLRVKSGF